MKRIHPDFDTRYLSYHPDQTTDGVWDRAHNPYGYGHEEATQDGMSEYADYVSSTEIVPVERATSSLRKDPKELARVAFMRSDRSQDHSTGHGRQYHLPKIYFGSSPSLEYKVRNTDSFSDNDHSVEPFIISPHEDEKVSVDEMAEYTNWLDLSGQVDTTSNRNVFFMRKGTSEEVKEEREEFTGAVDPNKKIKIRVMTINGPGIIQVYPDELNADYNDSAFDDRFLNGDHELLAKIDGMRSSAARRLATDRTYQGYSADDEPADWHDGFIIR